MTLGQWCCNWVGSDFLSHSHNTIHRPSHLLWVICGGYGSIRSILSGSLFIPTKIHVSRSSETFLLSQAVLNSLQSTPPSLTCGPERWGVCCLSADLCRQGCRCHLAWTRSRLESLFRRPYPCLPRAYPCRLGRWHLGSVPEKCRGIIVTFSTTIILAARLGRHPITKRWLITVQCLGRKL